jgi:hypothetical protein
MRATAERNGMIELLQREGRFSFRWASVLERTYARREPVPDVPLAAPPAAAGTADAEPAEAPAPSLAHPPPGDSQPDSRTHGLLSRPAGEHAQALLRWLWADGRKGWVFQREIEAAYVEMCAAHRWRAHHWNQTGAHFHCLMAELTGVTKRKWGRWYDGAGRLHRLRHYLIPAPGSGGDTDDAADSGPAPMRAAA